jgi:hypothetical protein
LVRDYAANRSDVMREAGWPPQALRHKTQSGVVQKDRAEQLVTC